MTGVKQEVAQLDLSVLITYGVRPEEKEQALAVCRRFQHSPEALALLRSYYADLPEAREEVAVDLRVAASRHGSDLIVLRSTNHDYLYLHADNRALFLGEFKDGIGDLAILHHFDFRDQEDFWQKTGRLAGALPSLPVSGGRSSAAVCVVCGVRPGEFHILGCPVELCPWCQAQLSRCNCRFDQLGVSAIEDEDQLDRFEELLQHKGRVPFEPGQNPSYPVAGDDPPPFSDKRR